MRQNLRELRYFFHKIPSPASKDGLDVLVTGHEDGSVKFWNCSSIALSLMASIKTGRYVLVLTHIFFHHKYKFTQILAYLWLKVYRIGKVHTMQIDQFIFYEKERKQTMIGLFCHCFAEFALKALQFIIAVSVWKILLLMKSYREGAVSLFHNI